MKFAADIRGIPASLANTRQGKNQGSPLLQLLKLKTRSDDPLCLRCLEYVGFWRKTGCFPAISHAFFRRTALP
jgi:hypothetical protein